LERGRRSYVISTPDPSYEIGLNVFDNAELEVSNFISTMCFVVPWYNEGRTNRSLY
jgi:hypothetical protein